MAPSVDPAAKPSSVVVNAGLASISIDSVAIACIRDPQNVRSWSGTPANISLAFQEAGLKVVAGGPLDAKEPWYYRWLRSAYWRLGRGWFMAEMEPNILNQRGVALRNILRANPVRAIVSIQPDPIVALNPGVPTALVHDCTFATLLDYYKEFTGLSKRSIEMGHKAYRQAIQHSSALIFSSEWAASSAVRDYGADPAKVHVIEFGANLQNPPSAQMVKNMIHQRTPGEECRFLFLGVEWERKGGDDAIALVNALREMGVPAFLDVVGCSIPVQARNQFCTEYGFLDKSKNEDRQTLESLFERASFLLVPSRAECFGCVYCEANAYGLPSIGRDTGGVSQAIRPGVNGFLLSEDGHNMGDLSRAIADVARNPETYRQLAETSRREFESRLNWGTFVRRTLRVLESV